MSAARWQLLPRSFFSRPVLAVAPDLLGCVLAHETDDGLVAVELVEVEAYAGDVDPASHAFRGQTARNAVMFGQPGHAYVYFTYGMHYCVNLVCQPPGEAAAVLLRAGRVVEGTALAAARRTGSAAGVSVRELARGPARLCQALAVGRAQNGADVCDPSGSLRVLRPVGIDRSARPTGVGGLDGVGGVDGVGGLARTVGAGRPAVVVERGPRVGVRNGATQDWRFWIAGEPAVSAYRAHVPRRPPRTGSVSAGEVRPRDHGEFSVADVDRSP